MRARTLLVQWYKYYENVCMKYKVYKVYTIYACMNFGTVQWYKYYENDSIKYMRARTLVQWYKYYENVCICVHARWYNRVPVN